MKWKLVRDALNVAVFVLFGVCLAFGQDEFDFVGFFAGLRASKFRGHAAGPSFCTAASERVYVATNGCYIGFVLDPRAKGCRRGRA
jgi:hypothetical protein